MNAPDFPGYTVARRNRGGGMTDSYVAHDREKRRVLIRCPKAEYLKDRQFMRRYHHGGDVLAGLDHPHIVKLLDRGQAGGRPFMVLEYVEALTVRELLLGRDAFLRDNALSFIRQLAATLHYLHTRGYLHLDLKPENILVREDGHVFLIDFDLATPVKSRPTRLRQLPGTPAYLAPETVEKRLVNEQTDIYSFGITAYEMLTLRKPYEADSTQELTRAQLHLSVDPTPMRQHNPEVPARVESIIFKCLAKQPDNRYPSMSLVWKDLESLV